MTEQTVSLDRWGMRKGFSLGGGRGDIFLSVSFGKEKRNEDRRAVALVSLFARPMIMPLLLFSDISI